MTRCCSLALAVWLGVCVTVAGNEAPPAGYEVAPMPVGSIRWQFLHQEMEREQERHLLQVPIPEAVRVEVAADESLNRPVPAEPPGWSERARRQLFWGSLGLVLLGGLVLRWTGARLVAAALRCWNPWESRRQALALAYLRAEDQALAQFRAALQTGPAKQAVEPGAGAQPWNEFLAAAAAAAAEVRELLSEAASQAERERMLEQLRGCAERLDLLAQRVAMPELRPAWQLASALRGLLNQLVERANTVTPSTLRTLGSGLGLLRELLGPEVPASLSTEPPLRFLTVDDDPICLKAVSRSLSRLLPMPDEAHSSPEALALAQAHAYDVVFLDIQLPGMDGFELCSKILATAGNRQVPVVFVTAQSDYEARVRANQVGGNELIAKPFLTFEIAAKALALGLRARLEGRGHPAALRS